MTTETYPLLDQMPTAAADLIRDVAPGGSSLWDYFVGDLGENCTVMALVITEPGAPRVPSAAAREKWRRFKEVLRQVDDEAYEDSTVALYRELPARDRRIVDDLVRSLSERQGKS